MKKIIIDAVFGIICILAIMITIHGWNLAVRQGFVFFGEEILTIELKEE